MTVRAGKPYAKIHFATETGGLTIYQEQTMNIDNLDLDIIRVNTHRDIGAEDCATFDITLVYREEWYKKIGSNDMVTIELGRGEDKGLVFFGMVDSIYKSWAFRDLKPIRTIQLAGRGFNKALVQFSVGAIQEVDMSGGEIGFFANQAGSYINKTPTELIAFVYDYFTKNGLDIQFADGHSWQDYVQTRFISDNGEEDTTLTDQQAYYQYQGGLWDFIKELRNAPFYEIYWEIYDDKPTMIVRPTPFNPENWEELPLSRVDEEMIMDDQTGRNDLETYTVYAVKGEGIVQDLNNLFGWPIWYKPFYKKYGLRRLEVVSKYCKFSEVDLSSQADSMADETSGVSEQVQNSVSGNFMYPLAGNVGRISSRMGTRKDPVFGDKRKHKGIDIAAPAGTKIVSVKDGTVVKVVPASKGGARGNYLEIQHDDGTKTLYQHCKSLPNPKVGQRVKQGQVIAEVGSTGKSTGPHLHIEYYVNGKLANPYQDLVASKKGDKGGGGEVKFTKTDWSVNPHKALSKEKEKNKEALVREVQKAAETRGKEEGFKNLINGMLQDKVSDSLNGKTSFDRISDSNYESFGQKVKRNQVETDQLIQDLESQGVAQVESQAQGDSVSKKTIDLFNWNIHNNQMENGTLTLRGTTAYKIGTRLLMESRNMEYYIEKVDHSFSYNEEWTSSLSVTRGYPYGRRFESPWNEWERITAQDFTELSGISQASMGEGQPGPGGDAPALSGPLQERIQAASLAKEGEKYDQGLRMKDGYSDCSSFVYKRVCEAKGIDWHGKWAPTTSNMGDCDLWKEIPLSQVQPWDILVRNGHTEFMGNKGKTYGAHGKHRGAGPGVSLEKFGAIKAYRVI